ncbi:MAG: hypothetical protein RLZZ540_2823 [Bacteroidota bacterium]
MINESLKCVKWIYFMLKIHYNKKYLDLYVFTVKMGDNLCRMNDNLSLKNDILSNFDMLVIG